MKLEQDVVTTGDQAFSPSELAEARRYSMAIHWSNEDNKYIVSVPELPGLRTAGATHREAVAMGEDAIASWIDATRHVGRPIPEPRGYENAYPEHTIRDVEISAPYKVGARDIQALRRRLGVSQRVFAAALNIGLGTLRNWEQGLRAPDGAAIKLLAIADLHPEVVFGSAVRDKQSGAAPNRNGTARNAIRATRG